MSDVLTEEKITIESEVETEGTDSALVDVETRQFLTFAVGEKEYAVDIMQVREIKGWTETTRLPNTPEFLRGVVNLRGLVIPIFDLRARFGQGMTDAHDKNVVIVLSVGERTVGVLVDAVSDILTVAVTQIKDAPAVETQVDQSFINGLISTETLMVVLLNMEALFDAKTLEQISSAIES